MPVELAILNLQQTRCFGHACFSDLLCVLGLGTPKCLVPFGFPLNQPQTGHHPKRHARPSTLQNLPKPPSKNQAWRPIHQCRSFLSNLSASTRKFLCDLCQHGFVSNFGGLQAGWFAFWIPFQTTQPHSLSSKSSNRVKRHPAIFLPQDIVSIKMGVFFEALCPFQVGEGDSRKTPISTNILGVQLSSFLTSGFVS